MLERRHEQRAHDAELAQMLGRAVDVGAQVEDVAVPIDGRQNAGDGRPVDASQRLEDEA